MVIVLGKHSNSNLQIKSYLWLPGPRNQGGSGEICTHGQRGAGLGELELSMEIFMGRLPSSPSPLPIGNGPREDLGTSGVRLK